MFGRKKRNQYFFYPSGGIEPERYMNPNFYGYNVSRQPLAPVYPPTFPPTEGYPNGYYHQLPYQTPVGQLPNAYPNNTSSTYAYAGHPNLMNNGLPHSVLQNPLQPVEEQYQPYYQQMQGASGLNQYPNQALMPKQSNGIQTFMNSFKAQDGSVDIPKMVNTAGQMVSAISQVQSMIKGFGGMLKV